ncbi:hypothetical protein BJ742DRAFT_783166 [Cladochytrium replicatum]|nr:hypothetical protein BJ742DRAFT_783166 [Cladochytrium replicatum]
MLAEERAKSSPRSPDRRRSRGDRSERKRSSARSPSVSSRSRSRSRSRSPERKSSRRHHRSERGSSRTRNRSRDRSRNRSRDRSRERRRGVADYRPRRVPSTERAAPAASRVLGVFGLSSYTRESDLDSLFGKYGPLDNVQIIYDKQLNKSRRFGFVTFRSVQDAQRAKEELNGHELNERRMRVDYSLTARPHSPTPGMYMGDRDRRRRSPPPTRGYRSRSRSR